VITGMKKGTVQHIQITQQIKLELLDEAETFMEEKLLLRALIA